MNKNIIHAVNLSKHYDETKTLALNRADLSIKTGEFLSITGPSGSGKSTLLNLIAGLTEPSEGEIFFKNQPLHKIKNLSLYRRKNIGYIFQDFYLYPQFSVIENILLPLSHQIFLPKKWRRKALDLLDYLDMDPKADHDVNFLSAGERQRVCIARAILCDPPLILADEPTGNLDTKNTEAIMNLLSKINDDIKASIVMVTHNLDIVSYAHRHLEIIDGVLHESS